MVHPNAAKSAAMLATSLTEIELLEFAACDPVTAASLPIGPEDARSFVGTAPVDCPVPINRPM